MKDYTVSKDRIAISRVNRAAESALNSVDAFVDSYNDLRDQAAAMSETKSEMPQLTSELLKEYVLEPWKIEEAYFATVKVPELAGVKVKLDTLDIDHPDLQRPINQAVGIRDSLKKQEISMHAYAIRDQGSTVIINEKWQKEMEESFTKKAVTEEEKEVFEIIESVIQSYEKMQQISDGKLKLNLNIFSPNGINLNDFASIYNAQFPIGYRRKK